MRTVWNSVARRVDQRTISYIALTAWVMTTLWPHQALAVITADSFATVEPLPVHSYRVASVQSPASPLTARGIRPYAADEVPEQRLAIASETVAVPTTASQRSASTAKVALDTPVVLEGEASYYSRAGCLGCDPQMIMANGQPLDDGALTMAIGADKKHLVGRQATVTNLVTGQATTVLITDTGGFYKAKYGHRVADLTIATKEAIGMRGGVGQVRVEVH